MLVGAIAVRTTWAAYTEPLLALHRVTVHRAMGGSVSLRLEGRFSLADVVQIGAPIRVVLSQGTWSARFDQVGTVSTKSGSDPEQPAAGPGMVKLTAEDIVVVLPAGFVAGPGSVWVEIEYDDSVIATNHLGVVL